MDCLSEEENTTHMHTHMIMTTLDFYSLMLGQKKKKMILSYLGKRHTRKFQKSFFSLCLRTCAVAIDVWSNLFAL